MTIVNSSFSFNSALDAHSHCHPFSDFGSPTMLFSNCSCNHNPLAFRELPVFYITYFQSFSSTCLLNPRHCSDLLPPWPVDFFLLNCPFDNFSDSLFSWIFLLSNNKCWHSLSSACLLSISGKFVTDTITFSSTLSKQSMQCNALSQTNFPYSAHQLFQSSSKCFFHFKQNLKKYGFLTSLIDKTFCFLPSSNFFHKRSDLSFVQG